MKRALAVGFVVSLAVIAAIVFRPKRKEPGHPPPAPAVTPLPRPGPWDGLVFPTAGANLLEPDRPGVLQPASGGDLSSARFGSVRTVRRGKGLLPSFHEGIDIAPAQRDRRGRPRDEARAVADGRVEYINRYPGNSDYGIYVVLSHDDPLGMIYTLYAHLANFEPPLRTGKEVEAGDPLGIMGSTSASTKIPPWQAHLHFEIGLLLNSRFPQWQKSRRMKPDHGNFNGWNLFGVDPLGFWRRQQENPRLAFSDYLSSIPPAFELLVRVNRLPDFFSRYPLLWNGPEFDAGVILIFGSENGVPLHGRAASSGEERELGGKPHLVRRVDAAVLGRNGCRLIVRSRDQWVLGTEGKKWLSLLTF